MMRRRRADWRSLSCEFEVKLFGKLRCIADDCHRQIEMNCAGSIGIYINKNTFNSRTRCRPIVLEWSLALKVADVSVEKRKIRPQTLTLSPHLCRNSCMNNMRF